MQGTRCVRKGGEGVGYEKKKGGFWVRRGGLV